MDIGGACESGLTEVPGCTGDCSCGDGIATVGKSSSTCVDIVDISEPGTNSTASATARECSLQGYADMHVHLNAHLAHGGQVFAGEPAPINASGDFDLGADLDVNTALSAVDDFAIHSAGHGLFGDAVGDGTNDGSIANTGAPAFNNWPTWHTTTHQQMYYKWLERAYRGGLRLMAMLAVTNEALCESSDGSDCANSMGPIDAQIEAAYDFQAFIDGLSGGPGAGWFRIVTTPLEARQVIAAGKLAVVLGIEVDNLFNCKENGPCPNMTDTSLSTIDAAVDHYYDLGVRHIFPVHNFDNAFGAAATWQDAIGVGQAVSEGRWWAVENCDAEGYGFWLDNGIQFIIDLFGFGGVQIPTIPTYINGNFANFSSCNLYGLNIDAMDQDNRGLGAVLINKLMDKGMIIDVDHMSRKSLADTITLTQQRTPQYPLVASHVQFFDLHNKELEDNVGRHERMRTLAQLEAMKAGGGMIAAMTKDDLQDTGKKGKKLSIAYTEPLFGSPIADDCRHSSKSFSQAYQYGVDTMGAPVALGSDFNGIAGHVGPRFGSDACGGDIPFSATAGSNVERSAQLRAGDRLGYPFTLPGFGSFDKQVTGQKSFDFNVDGLAHVGLLPDFVRDLENIGLSNTYVDALFNSAEEYIRVWERGEAVAGGVPVPTPAPGLSCAALSLCLGADVTPPPITCPANPVAECSGATTNVTFGPAIASADNCGGAPSTGCNVSSASPFGLGSTPVICTAIDNSQNVGVCEFQVVVQDTTVPDITAPTGLAGIECTSPLGASPPLGVPVVSDICDAAPAFGNTAPAVFPLGVTSVVAWTATDGSGNANTAVQTVEVVDTNAPNITAPGNLAGIECTSPLGASPDLGAPAVSDICDAAPAISNTAPAVFPFGVTSVVAWTATDGSGNASTTVVQTVEVVDTTAPNITAPGNLAGIECTSPQGASPDLGAPTVSDICDAEPAISNTAPDAPAVFPLGVTSVVEWTATDVSSNASTVTQTVSVVDTTPPEISCNVPMTIVPPDAPISFTATVDDVCDATPDLAVTGFDCFKFTKKDKRVDKTSSCAVTIAGDTVTILDSGGVGDHIEWTVSATDANGNRTEVTCGVLVENPGKGSI